MLRVYNKMVQYSYILLHMLLTRERYHQCLVYLLIMWHYWEGWSCFPRRCTWRCFNKEWSLTPIISVLMSIAQICLLDEIFTRVIHLDFVNGTLGKGNRWRTHLVIHSLLVFIEGIENHSKTEVSWRYKIPYVHVRVHTHSHTHTHTHTHCKEKQWWVESISYWTT